MAQYVNLEGVHPVSQTTFVIHLNKRNCLYQQQSYDAWTKLGAVSFAVPSGPQPEGVNLRSTVLKKKLQFQLFLWVSSSHILHTQDNYLLVVVVMILLDDDLAGP